MSYYTLLGLIRDPFVTTPDPDLFYRCPHQVDILERLEIAVRLRRGLSVVLGPVGTGKSTLSRHFMRALADNPAFYTVLMLDPYFESEREFLAWLNKEFEVPAELITGSVWQLKDNLKNRLYALGVEQDVTVCLIVDEGQKITPECMEVLRELLNYETNDFKLLQIVVFAQEEFRPRLQAVPNLHDRVYQTLSLRAFTFSETMRLIDARLDLCRIEGQARPLFTFPAYAALYWVTGGFPRKIIQLCHKAMLHAVSRGGGRVGWKQVWSCVDQPGLQAARRGLELGTLALAAFAAGYLLGMIEPVRELLLRAADAVAGGPPTG